MLKLDIFFKNFAIKGGSEMKKEVLEKVSRNEVVFKVERDRTTVEWSRNGSSPLGANVNYASKWKDYGH